MTTAIKRVRSEENQDINKRIKVVDDPCTPPHTPTEFKGIHVKVKSHSYLGIV